MLKEKIGIIGLGNMGGALARGMKKAGLKNIMLFDIDENRLNSIARVIMIMKRKTLVLIILI